MDKKIAGIVVSIVNCIAFAVNLLRSAVLMAIDRSLRLPRQRSTLPESLCDHPLDHIAAEISEFLISAVVQEPEPVLVKAH